MCCRPFMIHSSCFPYPPEDDDDSDETYDESNFEELHENEDDEFVVSRTMGIEC